MKLPVFWHPAKGSWYFGYWSSGVESLPNDSLLTYHDLEGCSEAIREADLVQKSRTPIGALIKFFCNFF